MQTYNVSEANEISLDQICTLFNAYGDEFDSIGNPIREKAECTDIACAEISVSSTEFFRAGTNGIQSEKEILIDAESYEGQTHAEFDGEEYRIYRRYQRPSGLLELYLTKEL